MAEGASDRGRLAVTCTCTCTCPSDRLSVRLVQADVLEKLGVASDVRVISAHRTPARHHDYVPGAEDRGIEIFICGAGMAAHLAGVTAALTALPVLGVAGVCASHIFVDAPKARAGSRGAGAGHRVSWQGCERRTDSGLRGRHSRQRRQAQASWLCCSHLPSLVQVCVTGI